MIDRADAKHLYLPSLRVQCSNAPQVSRVVLHELRIVDLVTRSRESWVLLPQNPRVQILDSKFSQCSYPENSRERPVLKTTSDHPVQFSESLSHSLQNSAEVGIHR